jgi:CheY-like chemotaxis protein
MTEPEKVSSAPSNVLNGLRILIIESNPYRVSILTLILEEAGTKVIETNLASTGFFALKQEQPDLVIIDLELTDEDGFSLIRKIREDSCETIKRIPAIAIRPIHYMWQNITTEMELSFQEFILCPIEEDVLIEAVVRLMNK